MKNKKILIKELSLTAAGAFLLAVAVNVFLAPNKISGGGVGTISTVVLYLTDIKMSVTTLACNALLFIAGYNLLGTYSLVKTASGVLFLTLFLEITSFLPVYTADIAVSSAVGGILMGVGIGLVVRAESSTGGSDFAALMVKKRLPHISIARIILVIDIVIISVSGIIFKSFTVTVYSALALYIASSVTDAVVSVGDAAKEINVFSPMYREIAFKVMEKLDRGITAIECTGMYSGKESKMLYCVVSPSELPLLINIVKDIDNNAFISINDVRKVLGKGFRQA